MHRDSRLLLLCVVLGLGAANNCENAYAWGQLKGAPCVEKVTPNRGSIAGGQLVALEGRNLWPDASGADESTCLAAAQKQFGDCVGSALSAVSHDLSSLVGRGGGHATLSYLRQNGGTALATPTRTPTPPLHRG